MAETFHQKQARLSREKYLMESDMARPGFQLLLTKLDQAADKMLIEYDGLNFTTETDKAIRIQIFREVVKELIPNVLEAMMNVDIVPGEVPWTFMGWLRDIRECIKEFLDNTWLADINKLFKLKERPKGPERT